MPFQTIPTNLPKTNVIILPLLTTLQGLLTALRISTKLSIKWLRRRAGSKPIGTLGRKSKLCPFKISLNNLLALLGRKHWFH